MSPKSALLLALLIALPGSFNCNCGTYKNLWAAQDAMFDTFDASQDQLWEAQDKLFEAQDAAHDQFWNTGGNNWGALNAANGRAQQQFDRASDDFLSCTRKNTIDAHLNCWAGKVPSVFRCDGFYDCTNNSDESSSCFYDYSGSDILKTICDKDGKEYTGDHDCGSGRRHKREVSTSSTYPNVRI